MRKFMCAIVAICALALAENVSMAAQTDDAVQARTKKLEEVSSIFAIRSFGFLAAGNVDVAVSYATAARDMALASKNAELEERIERLLSAYRVANVLGTANLIEREGDAPGAVELRKLACKIAEDIAPELRQTLEQVVENACSPI